MICDNCKKNEATVHTIQYINGNMTEKHLCKECAEQYGNSLKELTNFDFFSNNDFIKDFFNVKLPEEKTCPVCGFSFDDFKRSGFLGCPECYKTFRREIIPMLRRVHGNTKHVGAIPEAEGKEMQIKNRINELKNKLNDAVAKEDFEEAAKLRDEINGLKKETENGTLA